MKKYLLLAGVSAIALAAARPAHAAPPPLGMPSWAGFYVGVNAGYSFGNINQSFTSASGFGMNEGEGVNLNGGHHRADGGIAGGQFGYNIVLPNGAVFGFEADLQKSWEKGSIGWARDCEGPTGSDSGVCSINQSASIEWFGTLRARWGLLVTPYIMPYITAGLAYGQVKTTISGSVTGVDCTICAFSFTRSAINVGPAAGAGIEMIIPGYNNVSMKVEYLWINLGSLNGSGIDPIYGSLFQYSTSFTDNIIRAGINVHLP